MVAVGGGAQFFEVKERMRRDVGAFKSTTRRFKFTNFRRYPGIHVVREFGNDQIQWRSSSERRVVEYESRRSVRVTGGFFMRGVEFRSHITYFLCQLILLMRRYVKVVAGGGGLGMIFMLES